VFLINIGNIKRIAQMLRYLYSEGTITWMEPTTHSNLNPSVTSSAHNVQEGKHRSALALLAFDLAFRLTRENRF
jgi:hypothetical protein